MLDALPLIDLGNPLDHTHPLNQGRLAWWLVLPHRYGGSAVWDLARNYKGSFNSSPQWQKTSNPGGYGSLSFGSGSYVNFGLLPTPAALTVSLWMYATAGNGTPAGYLQGSGGSYGWNFYVDSSAYTLRWETGTSSVVNVSNSTSILNKWIHAVGTYDGSSQKLYINGASVGSAAQSGTLSYGTGNCWLGARPDGPFNLAGQLNDFGLWNTALTAQQVASLYALSKQGYPGLLNRRSVYYLPPASPRVPKVYTVVGEQQPTEGQFSAVKLLRAFPSVRVPKVYTFTGQQQPREGQFTSVKMRLTSPVVKAPKVYTVVGQQEATEGQFNAVKLPSKAPVVGGRIPQVFVSAGTREHREGFSVAIRLPFPTTAAINPLPGDVWIVSPRSRTWKAPQRNVVWTQSPRARKWVVSH